MQKSTKSYRFRIHFLNFALAVRNTQLNLHFLASMRLIMSSSTTATQPATATVTESILSNGNRMPNLGLGLGAWQSADDAETLEEAVEIALTMGYRHFNTSPPNDKSIGNVLRRWLDGGKIKREELFIVSKLPMTGMWSYRVTEHIRESLKSLQLDYVDLYSIQFPVGFDYSQEEAENEQAPAPEQEQNDEPPSTPRSLV